MKKSWGIFILAGIALLLSSCNTESSGFNSKGTTSSPSTGTGGGSGSTGSSSGTTTTLTPATGVPTGYSLSDFFVSLSSDTAYTYLSNVENSWGSTCKFSSGETSGTLKSCLIDVSELDLWYHGAKMQFNAPQGMCNYTKIEPYWYYNREVGYGPSRLILEVTKDTSGNITQTRCSLTSTSALTTACTTLLANKVSLKYESGNVTPKCVYDKLGSKNGANCCFGDYNYTLINIDGTGASTTSEYPENNWGGMWANCIGGAGKTNWDGEGYKDADGIPVPVIMRAIDGLNYVFSVSPPSESLMGFSSNMPIANYFSTSTTAVASLHYHKGYGLASGTASTAPYFVDPVSDRSGRSIKSANPYYIFQCLNANFEIKYAFNVMIREWNTVEQFNSWLSTGSASANPDVVGTAPGNCSGYPGEDCNDITDDDDIFDEASLYTGGAFYDTSSGTESYRLHYFPAHNYKLKQ